MEKENNITPGPWKLNAGREIETSSGKFFLSYGYDRFKNPKFKNFVELDANAELIASAPDLKKQRDDLLAACEAALEYLLDPMAYDRVLKIEKLRDAISKAKGE